MSNTDMRAIEAQTFSGYGGLRQVELPKAQPAKSRVLVRVAAARRYAARLHDPVGSLSPGPGERSLAPFDERSSVWQSRLGAYLQISATFRQQRPRMRTLIAGIGALGGTIATRAASAGVPVWLATRTAESARALRSSGLRVSGIGGAAVASGIQVAALEEYRGESFDLVVLATKAHDALKSAPVLSSLLSPGGTLLCIQNGGVSQILSARLGSSVVLGGVSNLGPTMV